MTVKELYRAEQLPVFQNRMFHTAADARDCTKGDVVLVRDLDSGLIDLVIGARRRRQLHPGLRGKQNLRRQIIGGTHGERLDHHVPDDTESDCLEYQKRRQQRCGGTPEQRFRQKFQSRIQTDLPFGENR